MTTTTESKATHTPTPWKIDEEYILCDETTIGQLWAEGSWSPVPGTTVPTFEEMQANAEFIVRAVNAHDDLVAAVDRAESLLTAGFIAVHSPGEQRQIDETVKELRAALSKAEGR